MRVWDHRDLTCQFVTQLPETPLSISLHPDGLQLVVAHAERLALYHIGLDQLLPW